MSPQTRRGKAATASRRKTSARGASAATRKPAASVRAIDEEQLDDEQIAASAPLPVRPRRRARGLARVRRTSGWRYASDALGAYVPLIIAFVVVFVGVWAWISWGPHAPTAKENWTQIESTWRPKVESDRQRIAATKSDFTAQMAAYTSLRGDLAGWAADLSNVSSWDPANATPIGSATSATPNYDAVQAFINAANQEVSNIDTLTGAATGTDVEVGVTMVTTGDTALDEAYAAAYRQLFGTAPPSNPPTLAVPSLSPCGTPGPSVSPGPSPSSSLGASGSPSSTPTPQMCVPASSYSPAPAGSAG